MEHGLELLKELPISSRLIRIIHGTLMEGVRGEHATPGEFRLSQNWIGWIVFFLEGVISQARDGIADAMKILALYNEYKDNLESTRKIPETAHRLIDELFVSPIISIPGLSRKWGLSCNSVKSCVDRLDIVVNQELRSRYATTEENKYAYYVDILST